MTLRATEKPPLIRSANGVQDFAMPADLYLVEATDLEQADMMLTVRCAKKRHQRPVLLMTDAAVAGRYKNLFAHADDVHLIVKPFSNKALWARAERIYKSHQVAKSNQPVRSSRFADIEPLATRLNRETVADQLAAVLRSAESGLRQVCVLIIAPQIPEHLSEQPESLQKFTYVFKNRLQALVRGSDRIHELDGIYSSATQVLNIKDGRFLLIFEARDASDTIARVARRLHKQISTPIRIGGVDVLTAPRIGMSSFPTDAVTAQGLLDCATLATNYAHREGLSPIQRFRACMQTEIENQAKLELRLRDAVEHAGFQLVYQPKVAISDKRCTGFEALIRWHDEELGVISPATFIPLAERLGLVTDITEWVVEEVCHQLAVWRKDNPNNLKVSLNLSGQDLQSEDLASYIAETLDKWQISAELLEVEITEGVLIEDFDLSCAMLGRLRDIGVSIALDDFGTGYSSLSYLNRMPITTLKLDRSFIQDIRSDWSSAAITSCVITLAQTLGLKVVAEGVETAPQLETLTEHECNEVQGQLFSMPIDAQAATAWLTA